MDTKAYSPGLLLSLCLIGTHIFQDGRLCWRLLTWNTISKWNKQNQGIEFPLIRNVIFSAPLDRKDQILVMWVCDFTFLQWLCIIGRLIFEDRFINWPSFCLSDVSNHKRVGRQQHRYWCWITVSAKRETTARQKLQSVIEHSLSFHVAF